jgi:hypothetical protein
VALKIPRAAYVHFNPRHTETNRRESRRDPVGLYTSRQRDEMFEIT